MTHSRSGPNTFVSEMVNAIDAVAKDNNTTSRIIALDLPATKPKLLPNEAMVKLLLLAIRNISKKWTMPIHDWKSALNQFTILFESRVPVL